MWRHAVPKSTENRDDRGAGKLFIDLSGPFHETSLGGMKFVTLYIDDFSRYKFLRFLRKGCGITSTLTLLLRASRSVSYARTGEESLTASSRPS